MTESGTPATKKLSSCPSRIYYTYISNDDGSTFCRGISVLNFESEVLFIVREI